MTSLFSVAKAASAMAIAAALLGGPVHAQTWPKGTVDVIIPSSPGGGFDTYARILAKVMSDNIGVQVVPKNISGGGGMRGAQAAFAARPDGQTFAIFNIPGIIEPVVNGENPPYDLDKINWMGAMAFNQYIVVVAKDSPYNTIGDLKAAGVPITFTGYGSSGLAANRIMCGEVGLSCKVITGYPGNNDALLGVVRGDAVASVTPITTAAAFNTGGDLKGLLLMSDRAVSAFPNTQTSADAGYPTLSNLGLVRAFGMPPAVKPEVAEQMDKAFAEALADPELAEWSKSTESPLDPMNAEELKELIVSQTALLTQYKDVIGQSN
jgi:tripartite-type tricarboxylate transporter receptor subunit TctC|tara:strand:- start:17346 stop:18311 length:966 start_codon:yes stop_codon:yes gene_type:complete